MRTVNILRSILSASDGREASSPSARGGHAADAHALSTSVADPSPCIQESLCRPRGLRRLTTLALTTAVMCVALLPLALMVRLNEESHSFTIGMILRPAAVSVLAAGLALASSLLALRNYAQASVATALFFILWFIFPLLVNYEPQHWAVAITLTVVYLGAAVVLSLWASKILLFPSSLIVLGPSVALIFWLAFVGSTPGAREKWMPVATAAHNSAHAFIRTTDRNWTPDIYFIVVDGLARPDVLKAIYGVDAEPTVAALRRLNATVPPAAVSNYSQTLLSLASVFTMDYLTELAAVMKTSADRRPLAFIVQNSSFVEDIKAAGYEFVAIPSPTIVTSYMQADRSLSSLPAGPTELEYTLLRSGPLRSIVFDQLALNGHKVFVQRSLSALTTLVSPRPMFVFAHVMAPHPPFVFDVDPSNTTTQTRFAYFDGDAFPGTREQYRRGYAAQARFVLAQLRLVVERLVIRDQPPIIVITADHGPGLNMRHSARLNSDAWERFAVFSMYFSPREAPLVPDDMSPVNALRWARGAGFGTGGTMLPTRSYCSPYWAPYDLTEVQPNDGHVTVR